MSKVCPSGWVCQAVRAPGSNVTDAPATRAGAGAWKRGSIRTVPVNLVFGASGGGLRADSFQIDMLGTREGRTE